MLLAYHLVCNFMVSKGDFFGLSTGRGRYQDTFHFNEETVNVPNLLEDTNLWRNLNGNVLVDFRCNSLVSRCIISS